MSTPPWTEEMTKGPYRGPHSCENHYRWCGQSYDEPGWHPPTESAPVHERAAYANRTGWLRRVFCGTNCKLAAMERSQAARKATP